VLFTDVRIPTRQSRERTVSLGRYQMRFLTVLTLCSALGCSSAGNETPSADSGVGPSGVPSKPVDQLTTMERAKLCDWLAEKWGGYAYDKDCAGGTGVGFHADQQTCLSAMFKHPCAVATFEQCALLVEEARKANTECVDGKPNATSRLECQQLYSCLEGK